MHLSRLLLLVTKEQMFPTISKKKKKVSICESESRSALPRSLQPHGSYSPGNSPGQHTGVGGLSLLQGIFPTQGSKRGLLHCRRILYQLSDMSVCTLPPVQVTCSPLSPGPATQGMSASTPLTGRVVPEPLPPGFVHLHASIPPG